VEVCTFFAVLRVTVLFEASQEVCPYDSSKELECLVYTDEENCGDHAIDENVASKFE